MNQNTFKFFILSLFAIFAFELYSKTNNSSKEFLDWASFFLNADLDDGNFVFLSNAGFQEGKTAKMTECNVNFLRKKGQVPAYDNPGIKIDYEGDWEEKDEEMSYYNRLKDIKNLKLDPQFIFGIKLYLVSYDCYKGEASSGCSYKRIMGCKNGDWYIIREMDSKGNMKDIWEDDFIASDFVFKDANMYYSEFMWDENDPHCCPSFIKEYKSKWEGKYFKVIDVKIKKK